MILSINIRRLWGRQDFAINFKEDINILTGSNGSGKTTVLKLVWYLMSGHLLQALEEIPFEEVILTTDAAEIKLLKRLSIAGNTHPKDKSPIAVGTPIAEVHCKRTDGTNIFSRYWIPLTELRQELNAEAPSMNNTSFFFPTFRRLEGGFSLDTDKENVGMIRGISDFAQRMSHKNHQFMMAANADDLRNRINEISSDIRVKLQPTEEKLMNFLKLANSGNLQKDFTDRLQLLLQEKQFADWEFSRPLTQLSEYVDFYFLEKSVAITDDLVLGSHTTKVKIEDLSSGEKNLLSFFVYAMSKPDAMFIDEPELGLHPDWQRQLIAALRTISPETQYFIVTHASAVRATYPDKQIFLDDYLDDVQ